MTREDDYEDDDGITLTNEQERGAEAIDEWLENNYSQHFRFAGCAGTGKSIMAKKIGDRHDNRVIYATFTNKAAHVLEMKGCRGVVPPTTIYKTIYMPRDSFACFDPGELDAMTDGKLAPPKDRQQIDKLLIPLFNRIKDRFPHEPELARIDRMARLFRTIRTNDIRARIIEKIENPQFDLKQNLKSRSPEFIIIDEASMVTQEMADGLSGLGVPIFLLVIPRSCHRSRRKVTRLWEFFNVKKPDFLLTEIHRQAAGSPIIKLASIFRDAIMYPAKPNPMSSYCLKPDDQLRDYQLKALGRGDAVEVLLGAARFGTLICFAMPTSSLSVFMTHGATSMLLCASTRVSMIRFRWLAISSIAK